jgi:hypothetical protein
MAVPTSQKDRPIGFVLDNDGQLTTHNLVIRPEDLTRTEPSRLTVQQTVGGAFVDNFGRGLGTITIAGHTGWRPKNNGPDWQIEFQNLHDRVYTQWHKLRADRIEAGLDPDKVKLVFVDTLDKIASVVAPVSFTLKRNKQRPLLIQYNLVLSVVQPEAAVSYLSALEKLPAGDVKFSLGLDTLSDVVSKIETYAKDIQNFVDNTLGAPVQQFLRLTANTLNSVRRIERAIDGVAASAVRVGRDLTQAGVNIFRTLAGAAGLTNRIRARLMEVAGTLHTGFCVIKNIFNLSLLLPDYTDVYGASNCSSTAGGRGLSPLRNENPLYRLVNTDSAIIPQSPAASASLSAVKANDPVSYPMSTSTIALHLNAINSGVTVA